MSNLSRHSSTRARWKESGQAASLHPQFFLVLRSYGVRVTRNTSSGKGRTGLLPLADGEFLKLAFFSKTNLQSSGCVSTPGSGLILILGTHCTKLSFVFRGPPTMNSKGHDRYWCTPRYRCTKVYPLRLWQKPLSSMRS